MKLILIVGGIICLFIKAFQAWVMPSVKIDFFALGWALLACGVLLPL